MEPSRCSELHWFRFGERHQLFDVAHRHRCQSRTVSGGETEGAEIADRIVGQVLIQAHIRRQCGSRHQERERRVPSSKPILLPPPTRVHHATSPGSASFLPTARARMSAGPPAATGTMIHHLRRISLRVAGDAETRQCGRMDADIGGNNFSRLYTGFASELRIMRRYREWLAGWFVRLLDVVGAACTDEIAFPTVVFSTHTSSRLPARCRIECARFLHS